MLGFIGMTHHALGQLGVVGQQRQTAKSLRELVRGQGSGV